MLQQEEKKEDDFSEDKGLQFIKSFLLDNLQLSGLYCFGIHHKNKMYSNALSEEVKARQHTHYYLLVFSSASSSTVHSEPWYCTSSSWYFLSSARERLTISSKLFLLISYVLN